MKTRGLVSRSPDETAKIGEKLAERAKGGELILLNGPLGSGKTVLARSFASRLGVTEWRGSPTFQLVHEYETEPRLYHIDFYRLSSPEVERLGLEEYAGPNSILLIEWPEQAAAYLQDLADARRLIRVDIAITGPESRQIDIQESRPR